MDRPAAAASGDHPFFARAQCEGCDIYVQPYSEDHNAGYLLVDLDRAEPAVLATMSAQGMSPLQ